MTSFLFVIALTLFNAIDPSNSFSISTSTPQRTSPLQATWSNGQAVKEYQDFLASGKQEIEKERDGACVIVKSSNPSSPTMPMVDALVSLGEGKDTVLTPGSTLPPTVGGQESFPIYITVPPTELKDFIDNLPVDWKAKREDFVFLSGGNVYGVIEPILKSYGYARDAMSQMLVGGFTTPGPIGKPRDLTCNIGTDAGGNTKIAGNCAACGKWAGAIQERLESHDITCKTGFYREWRRMMWERAAFDVVFNLVGALREEPTTIKDVALYYEPEVSDMLWEVTGKLRGMLAVTLLYGFEERLFGFAERRFGEQQCEIDEEMFPYTYCAPFDQSTMIVEYLNYAKDQRGLIPNTYLRTCSTQPSLMRQGNLRADGVI
jgi:hypothetical protein